MRLRIATPILMAVVILVVSLAAAPAPPPAPNVTFTVVQPLPATMTIGESYDFVVQVTSDTPFISVIAMPTYFFPGRYVTAQTPERSGAGTSAALTVTFTAKDSTASLPNGVAPVSIVLGARFKGGAVASQRFDYNVSVP